MYSDLRLVFIWWLAFLGIGLIFLPLAKKIFANFFDQGYLFSKVLGIMFSSYLVWLLASLKILPFFSETIWIVLIICAFINIFLLKNINPIGKEKNKYLIWVGEELMFFSTLLFWSWVRGFQPDIQGLEKFMDFGFVNSILRSKFFPPADMWFAGKYINYYYYGHYITAFLTKLTSLSSSITYNLMITSLFSFSFSLVFSLTGNLIYFWLNSLKNNKYLHFNKTKMILVGGLVSALIIAFGANLHPAFYNFKMKILKKPYCDGSFSYWYPNATRYIGVCPDVEDKTIHEFPSYSFIVSDLHGHVSDIPFVLTYLAIVFSLYFLIKKEEKFIMVKFIKENILILIVLPILSAIMFMTNQWDYPIYIILLGIALLFSFYSKYGKSIKTLINCFVLGCFLTFPSILLIIPFQHYFEPFFKGIAFVNAHSLFYQLIVLWGIPIFFGCSFLFYLFKNRLRFLIKKETVIKALASFFSVEIVVKKEDKDNFIETEKINVSDFFVIILFIVSLILILIPEVVYLKDIYIASHHRANTMFKLTYQSFIMFCVLIGYIFIRLSYSVKTKFYNFFIKYVFIFLIGCLLIYPFYSIPGYYGKLVAGNYKGLEGLTFLNKFYPDDYGAILWLNNNVSGQPVVLEAVGDSYTDYERISMATGLPTIQGWLVHEWLWRGSFDEPGKRSSEVQTIYESKDLALTKELLNKYQVKYLVLGQMEKTKYPNLNEEKFTSLGKIVFQKGNTIIYKLF
jgi:YYY domain-containing protein